MPASAVAMKKAKRVAMKMTKKAMKKMAMKQRATVRKKRDGRQAYAHVKKGRKGAKQTTGEKVAADIVQGNKKVVSRQRQAQDILSGARLNRTHPLLATYTTPFPFPPRTQSLTKSAGPKSNLRDHQHTFHADKD